MHAVLGQYELFTDKNTTDHLAWTIIIIIYTLETLQKKSKYKRPFSMDCGERGSDARGVYPMHTGYLAHGNSKGAARGRIRHQNTDRRVE